LQRITIRNISYGNNIKLELSASRTAPPSICGRRRRFFDDRRAAAREFVSAPPMSRGCA